VGGLSGSGKSRLARELACHVGAAPGAVVSRTDVLRKRLLGWEPYDHLGPEGYTEEMTRATYAALVREARAVLRHGHAVIADGVFATPEERAIIETAARIEGVPFHGLWLEAPDDVARKRIGTRRHNASDATADVLTFQRSLDLGPMTWARIDSSGPRRETLAKAREVIGL
jgi:predicted kinase